MALRGTELILFVRAQNQASYTLRRVAGDVRALTHARSLDARAEQLAIRQARNAARQATLLRKTEHILPGGKQREAFRSRQREIDAGMRRYANFGRERIRINDAIAKTQTQIIRNEGRQAELAQKAAHARATMHPEDPRRLKAVSQELANARQLKDYRRDIARYRADLADVPNKVKRLQQEQRALNASFREAAAATRDQRKELRLLGRQAHQTALEQRQVALAARQLGAERVATLGRSASHVGRVAQLGGLVGTAAFAGAASQAADFDTLVRQAATQARGLGQSFATVGPIADKIRNRILAMMQAFPQSADEMAASAYDIFSSVNLIDRATGKTDLGKGFKLMNTAARVAVAGNEDLETATNALITVVNNFGGAGNNLNKRLDTMFNIIRFGRMRLSDFNDMMNKIAPAAKAAGASLEDVGGAMAVLTEKIPSQTQVATQLSRLLQIFSHPDFIKGMEALHHPITIGEGADKRLKAPVEIIRTLIEAFPEIKKGGVETQNLIRTITRAGRLARTGRPGEGIQGTIYASRGLTQLARSFGELDERQKQIINNAGEYDRAYKAMMQSQGVQWRIFTNQVRAAVLIIGKEAIPVFAKVGTWLQKAIDWWKSLSKETQGSIVRWAAWISIGSLVGGILLSIVGSIVSLFANLRLLTIRMGEAEGGAMTLGARLAPLVGLMSALAGIGIVALAIKVGWTGDLTAKDFLMGAVLGGAFGAQFGPEGIILGAVTVPVVLEIISKFRGKGGKEMAGPQELYNDLKTQLSKGQPLSLPISPDIHIPDRQRMELPDFATFQRQFAARALQLHLPKNLIVDQTKAAWTANAQEAFRQGVITQQQYLAGMKLVGFSDASIQRQMAIFSEQTARNYINIVPHQKKLTAGQKFLAAMNKAEKDAVKSYLAELNKYYDQVQDKAEKTGDVEKAVAQAGRQARQQAIQEQQQAAARLTDTYNQLLSANQQAFGQLFQGPFFQEFGQLMDQWDIKPKIQDMTKDLQEQLNNFNSFNNDLAAIARRGAPAELVNQLKALGPDALDKIEVLRKAAPGQFDKFVGTWKRGQDAIQKATKIDFNKQLQQWFKYGKGIAQQIIFGLRSENVALDNAFRKYITDKFPNYVAEAVKKAEAEERKQHKTGKTKPAQPKPPTRQPQGTTVHHTETTTVHVHPQPGENTSDAARRAAYIIKHGTRTKKKTKYVPGVTDYPTH